MPAPASDIDRFRAIVQAGAWRKATSAQFKDAPHSYLIAGRTIQSQDMNFVYQTIKNHGEKRMWRGHPFKYFFLDGCRFWIDWPAFNRALETEDPLDP